ncbi:MAG: glycosyltransferase [Bdellovibrionaceae bacterium]|nr:glycosyltransferase [Bdellovibrionales bacterium]MCB9086441.1 glycosyltransferase [Pseudobdellovibrionaceae bacterium]
MHSETASISLAIITFDEGGLLLPLFRQIFSEPQDSRPIEVLVVHNGGKNSTLDVLRQAQALSPIVFKIFEAPQNNLGHSRAMAVNGSCGELIAFVDGDCQVPPGWLARLRENLRLCQVRQAKTGGVGGPNRMDATTRLGETLNLVLSSPLGHGGSAQAQWVSELSPADHIPTTNALFVRRRILDIGNFDSSFSRTCEDVDLGVRLNQSGSPLFMGPDPVVINRCANDWREWGSRMVRFGYSQARWISAKRRGLHLPSIASAAGTLTFALLPLIGFFQPRALHLYAIYGALLMIESWRLYRSHRKIDQVFPVIALMALTHFSYGWGSLRGYWDLLFGLNKVQTANVSEAG